MRVILYIGLVKIIHRPAHSVLGILLFGIGVAIISMLLQFQKSLEQFTLKNLGGIDMVVGAKGSPLQLILSTVFHLDYPTGNISAEEALEISRHPLIHKAIPIALGDNYQGFRIVGTTRDYPSLYQAELFDGKWFEAVGEVTLGYDVARKTGLKTGDSFFGVHGFHDQGHVHDEFRYVITGIMKKNHTALDRIILTPVESVWEVHGLDYSGKHPLDFHHIHTEDCDHHDQDDHNPMIPQADIQLIMDKMEKGLDLSEEELQRYLHWQHEIRSRANPSSLEYTALLLAFSNPAAHAILSGIIRQSASLQAAVPVVEYHRLLAFLDPVKTVLKVMASITMILSGFFLFLHLWNILRQSEYDLALLRVLGSSPHKILLMLLWQGFVISLLGWLAGVMIMRWIWVAIPVLSALSGGTIPPPGYHDFQLLGLVIVLGLLSALPPAVAAYRLNIHQTLAR